MHKIYIDKIIHSNDNKKMEDLRDVLEDTIFYIKDVDEDTYNKIECDLYEIAVGKVLDENMAKEWVNNMKPKAKWNLNDTDNIIQQYNSSLPRIPAYVIMNMLFSDFSDVLGEEMTDEVINRYVRAAEDWYYDEDAEQTEDAKLYCYWRNIVN